MLLDSLSGVSDFIFGGLSQIWQLYTAGTVLGFAVVLWILDRIFGIFDALKK